MSAITFNMKMPAFFYFEHPRSSVDFSSSSTDPSSSLCPSLALQPQPINSSLCSSPSPHPSPVQCTDISDTIFNMPLTSSPILFQQFQYPCPEQPPDTPYNHLPFPAAIHNYPTVPMQTLLSTTWSSLQNPSPLNSFADPLASSHALLVPQHQDPHQVANSVPLPLFPLSVPAPLLSTPADAHSNNSLSFLDMLNIPPIPNDFENSLQFPSSPVRKPSSQTDPALDALQTPQKPQRQHRNTTRSLSSDSGTPTKKWASLSAMSAIDKVAERRRRNRESSSRCYYNRKRIIDSLDAKILEEKKKLTTLYDKALELRHENAKLKRDVATRGIPLPTGRLLFEGGSRPDPNLQLRGYLQLLVSSRQ